MMKLWELRQIGTPAPDTVAAFIVRADTQLSAHRFASEKPGSEGGFVWLDDKLTTCAELTPEGDAGIVMVHFTNE